MILKRIIFPLLITVFVFILINGSVSTTQSQGLKEPCNHEFVRIPQSECEAIIDFYVTANITNSDWLIVRTAYGRPYYSNICGGWGGGWDGIYCEGTGNNRTVVELIIQNHELTDDLIMDGTITPSIDQLTNLRVLVFVDSQLTGNIPVSLGNLQNLEFLGIYGGFTQGQLTGSIPASLGNLQNLTGLQLRRNRLSGEIPTSLGNLQNLTSLSLELNQLSGEIPASLGNLSQLDSLSLYGNRLSGQIPSTLGNLSNLSRAMFLHDNRLTGTVPDTFGNLTNATSIWLACNQIEGILPASLINLTDLDYFHFDENLIEIPTDPSFQDWVDGLIQFGDFSCSGRLDVSSSIAGQYYVQGASFDNGYDAFAANVDADQVTFDLNGSIVASPLVDQQASVSYGIGSDFNYSTTGITNTLAVTVIENNRSVSAPQDFQETLTLIGITPPSWLPNDFEVVHENEGATLKYIWERQYPDPAFEGLVTPPQWVPFVGGSPLGIQETQASMNLEVTSVGTGKAIITGTTGFDIAEQEIGGTISGEGLASIQQGEGIQLDQADFTLNISGKLEKEAMLVDVLCRAVTAGTCPLRDAEQWPVVGNVIKQLNNSATLKGELAPSLGGTAEFKSENGDLTWQESELSAGLKTKITLAIQLFNLLSASATGGGDSDVTFQFPANPDHLKSMHSNLYAQATLDIKAFECNFGASIGWSYPEEGVVDDQDDSGGECGLKNPIEDQIQNNYAHFQAYPLPRISLQSSLTTSETVLISNVLPQLSPALANYDNTSLIVWNHYDSNKPVAEAYEIQYMLHDGVNWLPPASVTNDSLQDFNPQLAFDDQGQAIVVWERNKTIQNASAVLDENYTNDFELAYAVWDGTSWSTVSLFTNNSVFDHSPHLTRGQDGQLMLIWRQNANGELLGDSGNPDSLMSAMWNGTGWDTPQTVNNNLGGLLNYSAAIISDTHTIVYSQDTDNDYSTDQDQELFLTQWNGASWDAPTQLTSNSVPDITPSLFYDGLENPYLLWLSGNQLVGLIGQLSGAAQPVIPDTSVNHWDYRMVQGQQGDLHLFWQDYSTEGSDIFYATFDKTANIFSNQLQLTHDTPIEKFFSPAINNQGQLHMAYNETELITETVVISSTYTVSNVIAFGQSDLSYLTHNFGVDFAFNQQGLSVNNTPIEPGELVQLSVVIENAGNQALINPTVEFYLDDPDNGGTLLQTSVIPSAIGGGFTQTITLDWTVPESITEFTIYVVGDPDNEIAELNEDNNLISRTFIVETPVKSIYLPIITK